MSKKPADSVDQQAASSGVSDSSRLRHDVLTPINHLLGYSEMLLEELAVGEQEELNEQVREIHAATKEAHFLIQQMLPAGQDTTDDKLSSLELLLAAPMSIIRNQVAAIRRDSAEPLRSSIEADLERIDQAAQKLMSIVSAFPAASTPSAFPLETQPYPLHVEPERSAGAAGASLSLTTIPPIATSSSAGSTVTGSKSKKPPAAVKRLPCWVPPTMTLSFWTS